jgi:hypothetical protein
MCTDKEAVLCADLTRIGRGEIVIEDDRENPH